MQVAHRGAVTVAGVRVAGCKDSRPRSLPSVITLDYYTVPAF